MTLPKPPGSSDDDGKSRLAKAIEARGRKFAIVDVSHLGLTREADKPVAKIAIRVNTKGEEDRAIVDAWKRIEAMAKGSDALKDGDLTTESKLCHALWNACRDVDEQGQMAVTGVFPSPGWMLANLTTDELAALLNIYNDVRFRYSPHPFDFNDDETERVLMLCADGADTEIPTALLAGIPREVAAQYLILAAVKLKAARTKCFELEARLAQYEPEEEVAEPDDGPPEDPSQ